MAAVVVPIAATQWDRLHKAEKATENVVQRKGKLFHLQYPGKLHASH